MINLAVVGNPIEHSLSPLVFNLFAKEFAIELTYTKILAIDDNEFKLKINNFFACGGLALNVTSPFKELAYLSSKQHTVRANFCKAANFLRRYDGYILGDTTDGIGLVKDITINKKISLRGKKILIIGSGFVLDSILLDLIVQNPLRIDILARNVNRVDLLQRRFSVNKFVPEIEYEIVLNSIPNTVHSEDNELFRQIKRLARYCLCYDLTYNGDSSFIRAMQQNSKDIIAYNGLGMLVEQARIAFIALFDKQPNSLAVLHQLVAQGYHNV